MLIFGLLLSRWQYHELEDKLASALLLERKKNEAPKVNDVNAKNTEAAGENGIRKSSVKIEKLQKLQKWAFKRFKIRTKFFYPSFWSTLSCWCCC